MRSGQMSGAEQMMNVGTFAAPSFRTTIMRRGEAPLADVPVSSEHLGAFHPPLAG